MSNRYISTTFWDDEWVQDLDSDGKVLYLYLLTCQSANIAGVYKVSVRRMSFDTAVSEDKVRELLARFEEDGKVYRFREYVILKNWLKYQNSGNVRVRTGIERILKDLPEEVIDFCVGHGLLMYDRYMTDTTESDTKHMGDTPDVDKEGIGHGENPEKPISVLSDSNSDLYLDSDLDLKNTTLSDSEESSAPVDCQFFVDKFNEICTSLPHVQKVTDKRRKAIKAMLGEFPEPTIIEALHRTQDSDFLSGRDGHWAGCSFDWLFIKGNMLKVLEGNYDNKRKKTRRDSAAQRPTQHFGSSDVWNRVGKDGEA